VDRAEAGCREHDPDETAVQEQLQRLLVSQYFSHSRRFPSFLKFVVEQALLGQADLLKERTIGIEVFGKDVDYDTASDSVVRVTAAEIRKRIAQYYQEPGHENELHISLPSGSYIPQFRWSHDSKDSEEAQSGGIATSTEELSSIRKKGFPRRVRLAVDIILALAALLGVGAVLLPKAMMRPTPLDLFWAPVLNSSEPVLFCIADQNRYAAITLRDAIDPDHQITLKSDLTAVVIDDLSPIVRIGSILQIHGKKYTVRGEGATNLTDLRNGPTVFIGAFDNVWTLRLTKSLRYRFANNPGMTDFGIVDSQSPSQMRWAVSRQQQLDTNNYKDFAIIASFTDNTTGKLAIVAAGVGQGGTIAAGEFLTNSDNLVQIGINPKNRKNMEIVLSTQIIGGEPGIPKIEAVYYW
jgi:hypothetical protein